jgi:hypothetical protein
MISKIVSPLVVGMFNINIRDFPCWMDSPPSQLDPYNPPNDHQILYAFYDPSQQNQTLIEDSFSQCNFSWQF